MRLGFRGSIFLAMVGLVGCADDVGPSNLSGVGGTDAPATTGPSPFETTIDPTIDPGMDTGDTGGTAETTVGVGDDDDDDDDVDSSGSSGSSESSGSSGSSGSSESSGTGTGTGMGTETDGETGGLLCGDEMVGGDEVCDGDDLDGNDCVSLGFDAGPLGCLTDCSDFDTSACLYLDCGDDIVQLAEVCDGSDLVGEDCVSQGFDAGTLGCLADCTAFDTSACVVFTCGDGTVDGVEVCDGMDLDGQDCVSQGFDGGMLACAAGCAAFDTSGCFACGDDVTGGPEVCDGTDLGGQDCISQGFDAGTLTCLGDCTDFDFGGCIDFVCGDDMIEGTEVCDGSDLAGITCLDFGFAGGTLACSAGCGSYDTSGCLAQICGNDTIEGTEACDGSDLAGQTCVSQGFDLGTLACLADCSALDTSGCALAPCEEEDLGSAVGPAVGSGTTVGEDDDFGLSCAGGGGPDRVLRWVAPADGDYVFDTIGSDYDTALAIFDSCDVFSELDCNDDTVGLLSELTMSMTAGQEIRIVVDGFSGDVGNWVLNISAASVCAEESIGSSIGSAVSTASTVGEDDDFPISCANGGGPDRIIEFIPPVTGSYDIDTFGSDYDSAVAVFDGCDAMSELACNDDVFGLTSQVNVALTAGVPVSIAVDGFSGDTGNYVLNIQSLVCVDADIDFAIGTPATSGNTTGADDDLGVSCAGGDGADTVIAFTAPAAGTYVFDTVGSGYDTAMALYDSCVSVELACNDDTVGLTSEVSLAMALGQTVLVVVDGFSGAVGAFDLNITAI